MSDLDASVQWAASQGGDIERLGVTGFCWGGRAAWLYAAHNPACRAAAAWYGRIAKGPGPRQVRPPIELAHDPQCPPTTGPSGGNGCGHPARDRWSQLTQKTTT